MIQVSDEQIAERDQWERRLKLGTVNLMDGLFMMLATGAPATPYLLERLNVAHTAYNDGKHEDLAAAFGCDSSKREKNKNSHETKRSNVKFHVESFRSQNFPLLNPNQYPDSDSAFKRTAELLGNISASTVCEIFYDRDLKGRKENR